MSGYLLIKSSVREEHLTSECSRCTLESCLVSLILFCGEEEGNRGGVVENDFTVLIIVFKIGRDCD